MYDSCVNTRLINLNIETGKLDYTDAHRYIGRFVPLGDSVLFESVDPSFYYIYGYLTIVGYDQAIPMREDMHLTGYSNFRSLDSTEYGDIFLHDRYPDMAVGRLKGISVADVSATIARSLFPMQVPANSLFMASSFNSEISRADKWNQAFSEVGYDSRCSIKPTATFGTDYSCDSCDIIQDISSWASLWANQELVSYMDHGSSAWAGINSAEIPELSNSLVFNDACSTCASTSPNTFCITAMRQGALAHFGALSVAYTGCLVYKKTIDGIFKEGLTLGMAFAKAFNPNRLRYMTTMLGDPVLDPNPPYKLKGELPW